MKEIKVTCKAADYLPVEKLREFQGNLCELTKDNLKRIKVSLIKHGLFLPVAIWVSPDNEMKIIDGHARIKTLLLLAEDGYIIPSVPVVYVEAETEKEAKEKVLLARSQFHKTTDEGLYEFLNLSNLNWEEIKEEVYFPEIDLNEFEMGYMGDQEGGKESDSGDMWDGEGDRVRISIILPSRNKDMFIGDIGEYIQKYEANVIV